MYLLQHSALDGMVTVDVCTFCIKEFATMNMDFSNDSIPEPIKFDKIDIEITDEMKKDIVQVKEELITKANDLSFELFEFKGFGKSKLKELRLHPDAFVQICLQVAAFRTHQRYLSNQLPIQPNILCTRFGTFYEKSFTFPEVCLHMRLQQLDNFIMEEQKQSDPVPMKL